MSTNVIQSSFSAGELSPTLFARVDLAQYHRGAATMRNFFVDYRSGASTRMGTQFVVQALISSKPVRIIPFQTSVLIPYILEFGDFYMRPISKGNPVLETVFNITGVSNSNPTIVTIPGNNYAPGQIIFISAVNGVPQIGNRYFQVRSVVGASVGLNDLTGNPINSLAFGTYINGGTAGRVFQVASPYAASDLALLKYVQVANQMYIVHPSYPPTLLLFTGPTNWTFTQIIFGTTVSAPGAPTITASAGGSTNYAYQVTALDAQNQESTPSPAGLVNNAVNIGATAGTMSVTWPAVAGASSYNVYKAEIAINPATIPSGAAFGFIGFSTSNKLVDSNIVPDFTTTPPIVNNPFTGGNNPGAVCFFQQRLYYAGSNQFPQTFWASQPGFYNNFNVSDPTQEDDSITGTLVSVQVNFIKAMVPMPGGLIMLTANGAWQLNSGQGLNASAPVTPINATASPQAYNGISDVPPIVATQDVLYVQQKGAIVRDLQYNIYANIYTGSDISVMSNHLFYGHTIPQWTYAEEPFKSVWAIRDDGICLALTYVKEQEVQGWSRHDTLGQFVSTASVTEDQVDAVYFVVQRFIGGQWIKIIERMANRIFPYGAEDAWCVDCGVRSFMPTPAANLTISASSGSNVVVLADAAVFSAASMGQILRAGGGIMKVTQFISPTQVQVQITQNITAVLQNDPNNTPLPVVTGTWTLTQQFSQFFGLDYLNGQTVSILADGNVQPQQVVVGGSVMLPQPASKVIIGLPFTCQLKTMYLDLGQEHDTIQGKRKKISALTVRVNETRGLYYGQPPNSLSPIKELNQGMVLGQTIPLQSVDERVIMDPLWDVSGQITLQVTDPLPATVLGVIPEIAIGDSKDLKA